jgi:hypothetical protein
MLHAIRSRFRSGSYAPGDVYDGGTPQTTPPIVKGNVASPRSIAPGKFKAAFATQRVLHVAAEAESRQDTRAFLANQSQHCLRFSFFPKLVKNLP